MNMNELGQKIEAAESDKYTRPTFEKARDAVKALGDSLNGGNKDAVQTGALVGLLTTHRYLSNEMVIQLLTALGEFGAMPESAVSDARNEFAYKLCGKVRAALRDELFWRDK